MGDLFFGGLEGIRTLDPHNANVVRSQLRYKPVSRGFPAAKIILLFLVFVKYGLAADGILHRLICRHFQQPGVFQQFLYQSHRS